MLWITELCQLSDVHMRSNSFLSMHALACPWCLCPRGAQIKRPVRWSADSWRCRTQRCRSSGDSDGDMSEQMREDMQRMQQRAQQSLQPRPQGSASSAGPDAADGGALKSAKDVLDKVLIADFFFVCLALAWLAAGVGEKGALHSSVLLDAWYPLWQVVIQPALGVLMLGAVRVLLNIFSFMIQQVKHYSSTVDAASLRAGGQAEPVGSGV